MGVHEYVCRWHDACAMQCARPITDEGCVMP